MEILLKYSYKTRMLDMAFAWMWYNIGITEYFIAQV